jgi:hypothetical protein
MYCVVDLDSDSNLRTVLSVGNSSGAATDMIEFLRKNTTSTWMATIDDGAVSDSSISGTLSFPAQIISVICYGTTLSIWINGVNIISADTFNVGTINVDRGRIGAGYQQGAVLHPFDGRIGEIVLFSEAHTTLQRRRQEYRLSDMFRIPLEG